MESQTNSSIAANESKNNTVEDRLFVVEESLQKYEKTCGLPKEINLSENLIEKILNEEDIVRLTPEQYGENALRISRYAFHMQRQCNKETSKIIWLKAQLRKALAPVLPQIKAYSWQERKILAIANNDVAQKLNQEITKIKVRLSRLSYLGSRLNEMAEKYVELQRTARNRRIE